MKIKGVHLFITGLVPLAYIAYFVLRIRLASEIPPDYMFILTGISILLAPLLGFVGLMLSIFGEKKQRRRRMVGIVGNSLILLALVLVFLLAKMYQPTKAEVDDFDLSELHQRISQLSSSASLAFEYELEKDTLYNQDSLEIKFWMANHYILDSVASDMGLVLERIFFFDDVDGQRQSWTLFADTIDLKFPVAVDEYLPGLPQGISLPAGIIARFEARDYQYDTTFNTSIFFHHIDTGEQLSYLIESRK